MLGCIYKVTNNINGKIYIGQTIQTLKNRWYRHCSKSGISKAELNTHFKRAILKYGKENFSVEIIERCEQKYLDAKEIFYIKYFDSFNTGYNSTLGGQGVNKGFKTSKKEEKEIINLYKRGFSLREIGKEFKIDKATVKGVLTRNNISIRNTRSYKLTSLERQEIIDKVSSGISRKQIMTEYKISKSYLSQLISGKRRI